MVTLHQYSKVPDNIHSDTGLKLGVYVYTKNPFFKWKQLKKELTKFLFIEINWVAFGEGKYELFTQNPEHSLWNIQFLY